MNVGEIEAKQLGKLGFRDVFLPIFLVALAISLWFFHLQEVGKMKESEERLAKQETFENLKGKVRRYSTAWGWTAEIVRRAKKRIDRLLRENPQNTDPNALLRNFRVPRFKGIPEPRVWVIALPEWTKNRAILVSHPELASEFRFVLTRFFQELTEKLRSSGEFVLSKDRVKDVRSLFGSSIQPEYFGDSTRGTAFSVIYARSYYYLCWDLLERKGKCVGAILLLLPRADPRTWGKAMMENWKLNTAFPALIPLPVEIGENRQPPIVHKHLRNSGSVETIRKEARILPSEEGFPGTSGFKLPTRWYEETVLSAKGYITAFALDAQTPYLGVLFSYRNRQAARLMDSEKRVILGLFGIFCCLYFTRVALFGKRLEMSLKTSLFLWFFGLVLIPGILGFNAGKTFLVNREKNQLEFARNKMAESLAELENGVGRILQRQEAIIKDYFSRPGLASDIIGPLENKSIEPQTVLQNVETFFSEKGFNIETVQVYHYGTEPWRLSKFKFAKSIKEALFKITDSSWRKNLPAPTSSDSRGKTIHPVHEESLLAEKTISKIGVTGRADVIEKMFFQNTHYLLYHSAITTDPQRPFLLGIMWSQEKSYRNYLTESIESIGKREKEFNIFAIHKDSVEIASGSRYGDIAPVFRQIEKRKKRKEPLNWSGTIQDDLLIIQESDRFPGFILGISKPISEIRRQVRIETVLFSIIFLLSFILLILVVWFCSLRLVSPIIQMCNGLKSITQGHLDILIAENRQDELGSVGKTIDEMTGALQVRKKISRFVAPGVLEAVSHGSLADFSQGQRRLVTVLTTDIRDFTTLSERHPPREIFSLLNIHLAKMAEVIQSCGGIIDRFIGDAIIGVFHHRPDRNGAGDAVQAAIRMMAAHGELSEARKESELFPYFIGIGIDSGSVISGVLGDEAVQLDFSVIGDPVTRSAELESLSKLGQASKIVFSDEVRQNLGKEFPLIPIPGHQKVWEMNIDCRRLQAEGGGSEVSPQENRGKEPEGFPKAKSGEVEEESGKVEEESGKVEEESGKVEEESGKVEEESGRAGTGSGNLPPIWMQFSIWAIPMVLAFMALFSLQWTQASSSLEQSRKELQEEVKILRRKLQPKFLATRYFRNISDKIDQQLAGNVAEQAELPSLIRTALAGTESVFPGLSCQFFSREIQSQELVAEFKEIQWVEKNRALPFFPDQGDANVWKPFPIGNVSTPGKIRQSRGIWRIHGSGFGLEQNWEQLTLFGKRVGKDSATITACLSAFSPAQEYSQPALLIRSNQESEASFAAIACSPQMGVIFKHRNYPENILVNKEFAPFPGFPVWLRISQQDGNYLGEYSRDGKNWDVVGSATLDLGTEAIMGVTTLSFLDENFVDSVGGTLENLSDHPPLAREDAVSLGNFATWVFLRHLSPCIRISPRLNGFMEKRFGELFPNISMPDAFVDSILRDFQETHFFGHRQFMMAVPIFQEDPFLSQPGYHGRTLSILGFFSTSPNHDTYFEEKKRAFLGWVFFYLPLSDVTWESTFPLARFALSESGLEGGFMPEAGGKSSPRFSPQVEKDPSLLQFVQNADPGFFSFGDWAFWKGPVEGAPYRIVIGKPRKKEAAVENWANFLLVILVSWCAFFLFHLSPYGKQFGVFALPLKYQLTLAFLVAVVPALIAGILTIEKSQMERDTRLAHNQMSNLEKSLTRLDNSFLPYFSWCNGVLKSEFSRPEIRRGLDENRPDPRDSIERALQKVWMNAGQKGIHLDYLNAFPGTPETFSFPMAPPDHRESPEKILMPYLSRLWARNLGSPVEEERGSARGEIALGTFVDDYIQVTLSTTGVKGHADAFGSPEYWGSYVLGMGRSAHLFRIGVVTRNRRFINIQTTLDMPNFERGLFSSWFSDSLSSGSAFEFLPGVTNSNFSSYFLYPPFFSLNSQSGRLNKSVQNFPARFPADLENLVTLVKAGGEPLQQMVGADDERKLIRVTSGKNLGQMLIFGEKPIGQILLSSRNRVFYLRVLLLVLFFLTLLLSGWVADRFLEPIGDLSHAANKVGSGDFSVRLATHFSGEFGELARAFNQMAQEAESGKLLGQFVSHTVREMAGDGERERSAVEGEFQEVVVLFAGLKGFKQHLAKLPPEDAISSLNRYLETMSPIIRRNGGEIDKFIGEKILAVFRPENQTSFSTCFDPAFRTVQEMKREMASLLPVLPCHLGIGLVAGPVLSGILGTEKVRREYTVIGDTVNLASRLSDLAMGLPEGGVTISKSLAEAVLAIPKMAETAQVRKLEITRVKGKTTEIEIFELYWS